MIVVTTETVPGYKLRSALGVVRGNTIRARHVGRDVLATMRNLFGGEVREYTKLMAESREQAIDRMVQEAEAMGADGIVAVRFTTSMVMTAAAEILCFGTAVTLERDDGR